MKKTPIEQELNKVHIQIRKANYKSALRLAEDLLKKHPKNYIVRCEYAFVLGDCAEAYTGVKKSRMQGTAITMMRHLLRQTRQTKDLYYIFVLKNEYYWQTKQRLKQFKNGVMMAKAGFVSGYYCQGVGAAWQAHALAAKRQQIRAKKWAKISIQAWSRYRKKIPHYYNQYVHLALAYGVLGDKRKMEMALQNGAKRSGQPVDYREFAEIRELVQELPHNA